MALSQMLPVSMVRTVLRRASPRQNQLIKDARFDSNRSSLIATVGRILTDQDRGTRLLFHTSPCG